MKELEYLQFHDHPVRLWYVQDRDSKRAYFGTYAKLRNIINQHLKDNNLEIITSNCLLDGIIKGWCFKLSDDRKIMFRICDNKQGLEDIFKECDYTIFDLSQEGK